MIVRAGHKEQNVGKGHQDVTTHLTHELDPGNQKLFTPSFVFWNVYFTCLPCSKDTAFRLKCSVETIWTGYTTDPS